MDFEKFSQITAKQINQELRKLLDEWRKEVGNTSVKLLPLVDKFIDSCQGGKRIRGVLVVLGYVIGKQSTDYRLQTAAKSDLATAKAEDGRRKTEDIYKVAAAYEIFHTAILSHDDIIDKSLLRRGQPSLYQAFGGNHHGISQAICLGDAGFFLATRVILKTFFDGRQKMKALRWFIDIMLDTALGQMLDIMGQDPVAAARLKTARYTIAGPLVLGAILGEDTSGESPSTTSIGSATLTTGSLSTGSLGTGKPTPEVNNGEQLLKNLAKFGENLGVAFQIKDDILDAEADCWGGVDQAGKEAEKYKNQALKVLPGITKDKEMSKLLIQMAGYLVQRTK